MRFVLCLHVSISLPLFLVTTASADQPKQDKQPAVSISALIDKLVEMADSDIGYSATVTGHSFLPLDREGHFRTGMLFQKPSVPSKTMREIVKQGAAAVPHLIAHLDDKRKTKIIVNHDGGVGGMFYSDEFDYNERTTKPPPAPARQEDEDDEESGLSRLFGPSVKQPHTLTVGDRSTQQPRRFDAVDSGEKARYIKEGLIYDRRVKIDRALCDLLISIEHDDYLALACMERLVGRDHDADIEKYCRRRIPRLEEDGREDLQNMLAKLGWNLVHVAVDRRDWNGLRALIAEGANVQAKARNGMTPLHIAAAGGDQTSLQLLLTAKVPLDPKNARGETPVQLAAHADHDETVLFLGEKGCAVGDILTAAILGRRERAAALLSRDASLVHTTTAHKRTPLHLAACWGHVPVAELLMDKEAAVNAEDKDGWTPLHVAVSRAHESVARLLLKRKADVEKSLPCGGDQPLHLAVQTGDARLVKLLLAHKANVNGEASAMPLHFAVVKGNSAIVELLLEAGAAVEATDEEGRTPLHIAAKLGRADVARVLLKHKADVSARVRGNGKYIGCQPLHLAVLEGHIAVMEVLMAHKADIRAGTGTDAEASDYRNSLDLAAEAGHVEAVRCLLKHGADVNERVRSQLTPLYFAARSGNTNMVRFLLEHKAEVQASPPDALSVAACFGHREVVRLLLDRKPDISKRNKDEALYWADDPALVELLLDRGAGVNTVHENGWTPLHRIAAFGSVRSARVLLDHKANVRAASRDEGEEPLHAAARRASPKMAALLLNRGADINAQRKSDGRTPLHLAIEEDDDEGNYRRAVIALLLSHKADCILKDKDGLTPLSLAVKKKRAEIVRLLRQHGAKE
ncbi:MAG TPA: ankyrin repeat domain-containing protein [Gemmataceae bacterium]|jgi:ankyrin repeat protein